MCDCDELKYWVGFSKIPGIGRAKIGLLIRYFNNLSNAWKASNFELEASGIGARQACIIAEYRPKINLDAEIDLMGKYHVKAITCDMDEYPRLLKETSDFPAIIYIRGALASRDECSVAVVGTRRSTAYGRQVTEEIVAGLSHNNVTIISGLAKGIDTIAHRAAMDAGGRTIAVFANGLDIVYPSENMNLAREIVEHGALISEYPLGTKPKADNFPRRNRILSGLSLGVLVIESGEMGGALITANLALEQNREVFAVPGSIYSSMSKGPNKLIQDGAKLVRNYTDVLEELNLNIVNQQIEMKELVAADETQSLIIQNMSAEPLHIDEICRNTGLNTAEVASNLTILELKGLVHQVGNMCFILSKNLR